MQWRQTHEARRNLVLAHQTAIFTRAKKVPSLKTLLADFDRAERKQRGQTRAEVSATLRQWAAETPGVKIEKWDGR